MSDDIPEVSSLDEATTILRLDERRLRALVARHRIGHIKEGRIITFPKAALEQYIAENTIPALGPNPFGLTDRSLARLHRGRT